MGWKIGGALLALLAAAVLVFLFVKKKKELCQRKTGTIRKPSRRLKKIRR